MRSVVLLERRQSPRYALDLKIRYVVYGRDRRSLTGTGRTINISGFGLLFRTDHKLRQGDRIEGLVDWPANSPNGDPLILMVAGSILRTKAGATVILMRRRTLFPLRQVMGHPAGADLRKAGSAMSAG